MSNNSTPDASKQGSTFPFQRVPAKLEAAEKLLLVKVAFLLIFSSWFFGGVNRITPAVFAVAGLLSPLLFLFYLITARDTRRNSWLRYCFLAFPAAFMLLFFLAGQNNVSLELRKIGESFFWVRTTAARSATPSVPTPWHGLWSAVSFAGLYLTALNLLFIPSNRIFYFRLMGIAMFNALALAIFGLLQWVFRADAVAGIFPVPHPGFFSSFLYAPHFAALCLPVVTVLLGWLVYLRRRNAQERNPGSLASFPALGAIGLLFVMLIAGTAWSYLVMACLLLVPALHYLRLLTSKTSGILPAQIGAAGLFAGCLALAFIAGSQIAVGLSSEPGVVSLEEKPRIFDPQERLAVYRGATAMIKMKPLFGWGVDSFEKVYPLFKDIDVRGSHYANPQSDIFAWLSYFGFGGALIFAALPLWLVFRSFREDQRNLMSLYGLLGCFGLLALGFFDFPLAHPAIQASFWTTFFSALGWAEVRRSERRVLSRGLRKTSTPFKQRNKSQSTHDSEAAQT